MQHLHTDIVQSFWLRFWREPHQGQQREWRGTIWHEQQALHEKPTAVANPDEAFEFVRRALRASRELDSTTPTQQQRLQDLRAPSHLVAGGDIRATGGWWQRLLSAKRRWIALWRNPREPEP